MSMWVTLAKVSPDLLQEISERPEMLDAMLFEDKGPEIPGFDRDGDVFGEDYLHMFVPYFQYLAESAGEDPEDFEGCEAVLEDAMYRSISGKTEIDYSFCYGPAMYNDVATVRAICSDWNDITAKDLEDTERADVALYVFYQKAAEEGKAVICGIS